ncbi:UvrD/REP helicase [Spirochaeta thermophila DSM 6578]|uniref:DNA 3'-5' helicase n=1 Tax=Winmispira thermophila (strain ATCC 700085 / DSM 6578 / Z-1203) TaxID=869211 RepID=G0GFU6_WINT7|nr:UvrD-helicase domain-containing protein [Spirochaeta thermophila]AEJ61639.1 UvrD/REP helicase [Spirochaeta thermophila DSM 6578]
MGIDYRAELNSAQYEAVTTIDGPLLIIAGAGSGKTRVITYRIAYMLDSHIPQKAILALTFTNKAAREMWERVRTLTGKKLTNLTVGTFHSFGAQILREHIHLLGYRPTFSIYDTQDQKALLKQCIQEVGLNPDLANISTIRNTISAIKTGRAVWNAENEVYRAVYEEYHAHLRAYHAVDFDDLIVLPIRLFETHPEVIASYRERFRYILIDEFQDTSILQYHFIKLLAEEHRNLCVVGDDDQSIYSWRGANYENFALFERDFPERKEVKLEQNYRSVQTILEAANQLISHNTNRKEKRLWSGRPGKTAIYLTFPSDEREESEYIAETIRTVVLKERIPYHEIGVLVRTNSLMTPIEDAFLRHNIPYKLSGGTSFFERKEIKDIIAYLRVILNPDDDVSLLRIINTPRRGIGRQTLHMLGEYATEHELSIYSALTSLLYAQGLPPQVARTFDEFVSLIEEFGERISRRTSIAETVRDLVDRIDYFEYLMQEHRDNEKVARYRYQNLMLFADLIERWENDPDNLNPNLGAYLTRISLITKDELDEEDTKGKVNLMTIHAAKGLEFAHVFLAGVEDGIIPHARALEESEANMEEERRLFYVAITRAREALYLTSCRQRRVMREDQEQTPSPFLEELPDHLIETKAPPSDLTEEDVEDIFARMKSRFGS